MDLDRFHALYNFRKRSKEELQQMTRQSRSRSSSRSSYSSYSSRSSRSSRSSSYGSSRSRTRSRSRSLPYSRDSSVSRRTSDDSEVDIVDELLEASLDKNRGRKRKRSSQQYAPRSPPSFSLSPARCVLVSNLSETVKLHEVTNFMSKAGKISNITLDFCYRTLDFQKSGVVEFENMESVLLALGINGQKLKGCPVIVHPVSRKDQLSRYHKLNPLVVQVDNLPLSLTHDQLHAIFSPFGTNSIKMANRSSADITYFNEYNGLSAIRETHQMTLNGNQISVSVKAKCAEKKRRKSGSHPSEDIKTNTSGKCT